MIHAMLHVSLSSDSINHGEQTDRHLRPLKLRTPLSAVKRSGSPAEAALRSVSARTQVLNKSMTAVHLSPRFGPYGQFWPGKARRYRGGCPTVDYSIVGAGKCKSIMWWGILTVSLAALAAMAGQPEIS